MLFLFFALFAPPVFSGDFPSVQQTTPFKFFKPILKAIGYRPLQVHIYHRDTLEPIHNAVVMVNESLDPSQTFLWNKTDAKGNVSFDGFTLPEGPITITAAHENYSRYTLFLTEGDKIDIPLIPLEDNSPKTVLKGTFHDWPEMEDYDGKLHLGFMLPFLDIVTVLNLDRDKFLAPYVKAQIYEEMMVPGNFVAPTQEESVFGIISLFVSKPMYEMPFRKGSLQNLFAIAGEVPLEPFANAIYRKKPLIEIMNMIEMTKVGMGFDIDVPHQKSRRDLHLSYSMVPKFKVSVENALPNKDLIYMSSGAFQNRVASIFPIDFRVKGRNELNKNVLLKSIPKVSELPPFQEGIIATYADIPKSIDGSQRLDWAVSSAVARPNPLETSITFKTFLDFIDVSAEGFDRFSYRYRNPIDASTEPQLNLSFINIETQPTRENKGYKKTWWTILAPATLHEFKLPLLPGGLSQPPSLKPKEEFHFTTHLFKIAEAEQPFHYSSFNEEIVASRLTHFSRNTSQIHAPQ